MKGYGSRLTARRLVEQQEQTSRETLEREIAGKLFDIRVQVLRLPINTPRRLLGKLVTARTTGYVIDRKTLPFEQVVAKLAQAA